MLEFLSHNPQAGVLDIGTIPSDVRTDVNVMSSNFVLIISVVLACTCTFKKHTAHMVSIVLETTLLTSRVR